MTDDRSRHLRVSEPSPWLVRFAPLIKPGGEVLDLACGGGRHGRYLMQRGCKVTFLDRDISALDDLKDQPNADLKEVDMEQGNDIFTGSGRWPGAVSMASWSPIICTGPCLRISSMRFRRAAC